MLLLNPRPVERNGVGPARRGGLSENFKVSLCAVSQYLSRGDNELRNIVDHRSLVLAPASIASPLENCFLAEIRVNPGIIRQFLLSFGSHVSIFLTNLTFSFLL